MIVAVLMVVTMLLAAGGSAVPWLVAAGLAGVTAALYVRASKAGWLRAIMLARARRSLTRGRYRQAAAMLDRLVHSADAPTPSAVITRACLGAAHRGQGRLLSASAAYQQALDLAFRTQGIDAALLSTLEANAETVRYELETPRHDARTETAIDDANLAVALRNEGLLEEAESTARVALEQGLAAKNPDVPVLQTNLAAIRRERDDPAAAEELLVKAENTARRALGRRHPETLTIRASLAAVQNDLGRHAEAAALLEKVIADRVQTLGRAHSATLQARTSLGYIRLATADDDAADREFGTVLADGRNARDANMTPVLERATQGQALVSKRRRESA